LLTIGFAIAKYLREIIEDAEIDGWIISKIIFILYLYFCIYAIKTALISFDKDMTKWIIIVATVAIAFLVANKFVLRERRTN
jgi:hypothetical protein